MDIESQKMTLKRSEKIPKKQQSKNALKMKKSCLKTFVQLQPPFQKARTMQTRSRTVYLFRFRFGLGSTADSNLGSVPVKVHIN